MAKKKMTLEEKLEDAIVKDVPYEVPENWVWSKLSNISTLVTGNTPSKKNIEYYGESIPFIKPNDLDQGRRLKYSMEMLSSLGAEKARVLPKGSIAVCCIGSIGKTAYLEVEGATNQQINSIIPDVVENLYIYYYVLSEYFQRELISNSSATTISIINKSKMGELAVPLAPLKEQRRIVDRIESLFEKLDKAKELIEEARDDFEKRKSSILEKAFRGELTKEWRSKNKYTSVGDKDFNEIRGEYFAFDTPNCIPNEWIWVRFNQCCTKLGSGSTPKGGREIYKDSGIPFIRSQNVLRGKMELDDIAYISEDIHEKMNKTKVISGDTLLNITGASIGRASLLDKSIKEANVNQHVCIFRFKAYVLDKYPQYWFNSPVFQKVIADQQIGVTREALNFKQLRGMWIPLPSLEEQKEIVRILDKLLKEESKIEELTNLEEQIELIKKSILAKAFRGQLGTNCEEDESALELLKDILSKE